MDIVYDGSCLLLKAQQIVSCHSHYLASEVSLKSTSPANNLCRKIRGRAYRWVRTQEEARTSHGPCQLDRKAENTETLLAFPGLWDLARQRRSSRAPGPAGQGGPELATCAEAEQPEVAAGVEAAQALPSLSITGAGHWGAGKQVPRGSGPRLFRSEPLGNSSRRGL